MFFVNPSRDKGAAASLRAMELMREFEAEFSVATDAAQLPEMARGARMVVVFGGDGTILHAARAVAGLGIPLLGVNAGNLGFMAELEATQLGVLREALAGMDEVESRMMVDVTVTRGGEVIDCGFALNEAVVGGVARVIPIEVYGDGCRIMGFDGDGVIVSTPTGSTAYSMSAGGPIVEPTSRSLIVTPVCPHTLTARPYVLSPERRVEVRVRGLGNKTAYLSVDGGESFTLQDGDIVTVTRSQLVTKLLRVTGESFYDKVNKKFVEGL